MNSRARTSALTMGFILIVFGIIVLIENLYQPFSLWRLAARYWPVLPIIIGIKKLILYLSWPAMPSASKNESPKE